MYHYTYLVTAEQPTDSRKYYIGCRTSKVWPTEDNYFGSCKPFNKWQKQNGKDNLKKEILAVWPSRELAIEHEIRLHDAMDVAVNPEFWNQAKQTATKFDTTGASLTDEAKQAASERFKTIERTEQWRSAISEARTGYKMKPESKQKLSDSKKGKKLSQAHRDAISKGVKGRVLSEEHKRKISEANRGKKRSPEICEKFSRIQKELYASRKQDS